MNAHFLLFIFLTGFLTGIESASARSSEIEVAELKIAKHRKAICIYNRLAERRTLLVEYVSNFTLLIDSKEVKLIEGRPGNYNFSLYENHTLLYQKAFSFPRPPNYVAFVMNLIPWLILVAITLIAWWYYQRS